MNEFYGEWTGTLTLKGQPGSQPVSVLITESAVSLNAGHSRIEISLSGQPLFNVPLGEMLCATSGTFNGRKGLFGLRVLVSGEPLICSGSIFKGSVISIEDNLVGSWTATRQQSGHRHGKNRPETLRSNPIP